MIPSSLACPGPCLGQTGRSTRSMQPWKPKVSPPSVRFVPALCLIHQWVPIIMNLVYNKWSLWAFFGGSKRWSLGHRSGCDYSASNAMPTWCVPDLVNKLYMARIPKATCFKTGYSVFIMFKWILGLFQQTHPSPYRRWQFAPSFWFWVTMWTQSKFHGYNDMGVSQDEVSVFPLKVAISGPETDTSFSLSIIIYLFQFL